MAEPAHQLLSNSPIEVVSARTLFRGPNTHQRSCGSLIRLESGRLLMALRGGSGPARANDGAVLITHSDDNGVTWEEPLPVYARPGSDAIPMGGLVYFSDDLIKLVLGHITYDPSLGGEEPISDWLIAMTESRDGGRSWGEVQPEIRLYPEWTEMYGTSNPHLLSDGSHMFAVMGTLGRDTSWHSGVSFSRDFGATLSPPVTIAQAPERDYSDIDIVRLDDGRFLAVVREHLTRISVFSHSSDEGKTWTPIRPTGFKGANFKLLKLRSGAILAAYRDGGGERHGVSCSISTDGGEHWEFVGQLYAADPETDDVKGAMGVPCGYPDLIYTGERELFGVLHTFADKDGHVDLHAFQLRDVS